jgi:nitrite reductase (NADH) large subunit
VRFVIGGNGIAAITAARTIRAASPDSEIEIYTDASRPFYLRPSLIPFLAGRTGLDDLFVYSPQWYASRGIAVHLATPVVSLDIGERSVYLENGDAVRYDRFLLAVGSHPFVPPLEGVDQQGVFTLRSIDDALAITAHAEECLAAGRREAAVIGGGLLGLECAHALTHLGMRVIVLQGGPRLLHKQIDDEGAQILEGRLEGMGIRCLSNVVPVEVLSDGDLSGVLLEDGHIVSAHLVLCAAGVRSNLEVATASGLEAEKGVLVDDQMRTSGEDVYSAGDVAEYDGELWCIIPAALEQARVAAANMVEPGSKTYSGTVPSTTLKVVGVDLMSVGMIHNPEAESLEEVKRSGPAGGVYEKLVLQDGRVVGAILLGTRERAPAVSRLIKEGTDVSRHKERLLDDEFDLSKVIH